MHISLPTDGLYTQTIKDECVALEEHYGSLDWALNDPDPELPTLDPSLFSSRRNDPAPSLGPTKLPDTLINLQNANPAPAPQGFAAVLSALQNSGAFRDMAGLTGTQQLAEAGLETAASLATTFGSQTAALKIAEMANQEKAVADADKKLATIARAKEKGLLDDQGAINQHICHALGGMNGVPPTTAIIAEDSTPKEAKEAIAVADAQHKKGNISDGLLKDVCKEQVSNMKGSRPRSKTLKLESGWH